MVCEKCEKKGKLGKVNNLDNFVNFNWDYGDYVYGCVVKNIATARK